MPAPDLVNLSGQMDDAKCFAFVRQHRWPAGVRCPGCGSPAVVWDGCDDTQLARQQYRCKACAPCFDDLTDTVGISAMERISRVRRVPHLFISGKRPLIAPSNAELLRKPFREAELAAAIARAMRVPMGVQP